MSSLGIYGIISAEAAPVNLRASFCGGPGWLQNGLPGHSPRSEVSIRRPQRREASSQCNAAQRSTEIQAALLYRRPLLFQQAQPSRQQLRQPTCTGHWLVAEGAKRCDGVGPRHCHAWRGLHQLRCRPRRRWQSSTWLGASSKWGGRGGRAGWGGGRGWRRGGRGGWRHAGRGRPEAGAEGGNLGWPVRRVLWGGDLQEREGGGRQASEHDAATCIGTLRCYPL